MVTTFDRYLLKRFLHAFAIIFVATFGLYVVFDGFTNVDNFIRGTPEQSVLDVLFRMGRFYLYQSTTFFDMTGTILVVLSAVVVLIVLYRNGEIYPVLAAGVPSWRLAVPFVVGTVLVNLLLAANQELIIPRIADHLQAPRGDIESSGRSVDATYDFQTRVLLTGRQMFLSEQKITSAEFVLPAPEMATVLTTLKAEEAFFIPRRRGEPSGWLLKNVQPRLSELTLSDEGRRVLLPAENASDLIVLSDVSFDQLYNRQSSFRYLATPELIRRIRNPAFGTPSVRGQTLHLHTRLTRPLTNLIAVLLAIPLIVRRESSGLLANLVLCTVVMSMVFGLGHAFLYFGQVNLLAPDVAVWAPLVINGTACAWASGLIQT